MAAIICFVLVAIGTGMILLGTYMSYQDWRRKHANRVSSEPQSLAGTLTALGKLAEAIKTYPAGQQLIVWGIVLLIIAGVFGGIANIA
jgi:hypothetical protein